MLFLSSSLRCSITNRLLSTGTENYPFGANATREEKEAYLRALPATTPLSVLIQLHWQLLGTVYGNKPRITRVLLVNAQNEIQRSRLPLQLLKHPFFLAPLSEAPALLGLSLLGVLMGTVNYLHQGFLGLAAEPALLLLLLATARWCGYLEQLGGNASIYSGAVRRNMLVGILLFIVSEVMIFFALFWAFFHSALNPAPELGAVWPPLHLLMLE